MKTEELIRFLIETEFINYCDDYKTIDEIIERLEVAEKLKVRYKEIRRCFNELIEKREKV